ncbi:hypothetical protein ACW5CM_15070 [Microbacterium sp. A588]
MTRRLMTSSPHSTLRARAASLVGVVSIAFGGLMLATPAHAAVVDGADGTFTATCDSDGFRVELNGTITLDEGEIATSYLRIAGDAQVALETFTGVEEADVFNVVASTPVLEASVEQLVEWIVDDAVIAQDTFTRVDACATPTPEPTDTPTPTPTPSESPEPTPTPTPEPTDSPEPTPTDSPTPEPTTAPAPTDEPAPPVDPQPVPEETPVPAPAPAPAPPTASLSSASVPAGGDVTVTANGFAPGEQLQLWLHSDPWKMTDATADASGAHSLSVRIAGGTEIGKHQIEVRGATSGSVFVNVRVTDDLAITGIDSAFASGVATTGLVLVIGGLTVVLLARRARVQSEA